MRVSTYALEAASVALTGRDKSVSLESDTLITPAPLGTRITSPSVPPALSVRSAAPSMDDRPNSDVSNDNCPLPSVTNTAPLLPSDKGTLRV
jgi:hypothetical protein